MTAKKTNSRWGSSAAFIISSIAAAIGLGNIWKFPYIVHQYGGGAILICYLIALALLAFPVLIAEIALGKKLRLSTFYTFKTLFPNSKIWKFFGFIVSTTPFIILSYYTIVAGWTLEYTWQSLTGNLNQMAAGNGEEYFVNFVTNPYRQIGYFTLSLSLILATVLGGTERIEKSNKFLLPALFLFMLVLTTFSLNRYGGKETFNFLFSFKFSELSSRNLLEAIGHAFLTLSLGMGITITFGSYLPEKTSILKSASTIAFFDTLIAIMACFLLFPIVFATDLPVKESSAVLFTSLVKQFSDIGSMGWLISTIFFLLIFFAAYSSCVALFEAATYTAMQFFSLPRKKAACYSFAFIWSLGIFSCLSLGGSPAIAKLNLFDNFDFWTSTFAIPLGGGLIAFCVAWKLSEKEKFDLVFKEFGESVRVFYKGWNFLLRYLAPIMIVMIVLFQLNLLGL